MTEIYQTPPTINKSYILQAVSQEDIMEHYLGLPVVRKMYKNPLRVDTKPTAMYYKNDAGKLIFHDYSGFFSGDCFDVVKYIYKGSFRDTLNRIAIDFGLIPGEKIPPKIAYTKGTLDPISGSIITIICKPFSDADLEWWGKYHISKKTLRKFNTFSLTHVYLNNKLHAIEDPKSPMYGYFFGKKDGIELWKVYFPKKTKYRFLMNTQTVQGDRQLPQIGDILVVTKSLKDVMVYEELGISAIAPQSESVILTDAEYEKYSARFKYIIINYDGDRAGINGMLKFRKKYPKVICIPCSIKPHKEAKDVSDCVVKYGFERVLTRVTELKLKILNGDYVKKGSKQ